MMGNPMYDLMKSRYEALKAATREQESAWSLLADVPRGPSLERETEQEKCQGSHWWQQYCPHCMPESTGP